MKSLVHLLRTNTRWAIEHDDDAIAGVYAVPGPRAQGDEAASEPVLCATLLDDVEASSVPSGEQREDTEGERARPASSDDADGDPPPDGELN